MLVVKKNGGDDMAWEKVKLKDVCTLIVDCPHSTAPNEGKGYPLIRTPNIGRGRLLLDGVHRVSKAVYDRRNIRAIPQENDLIFAREATAGNVAIVQKNEKVCLGQRTVLLRPDPKYVDSDYLVYCLLAPEQQYNLLGSANGSTVAHVNLPVIRNLTIPLPPLDVQKRIGQVLKTYDDLIENNRRQVRLLEEAAQRLYKEWFVKLHFPGWEETKLVAGLPVGWKICELKELGLFQRGKTITTDTKEEGNVPVVAGGLEPAYYHSKANTAAPVITISASGANAGYTNLYFTPIWASDCSFLDKEHTNGFYWLFCYLKNNPSALANLQKGAAQPHVYAKDINQIELVMPTSDLIMRFEQSVSGLFEKISIIKKQIQLLQEARNRLLPRLMREEKARP